MKSKKIIALALTAAIAISAASMTAFAKEVKYNTATDVKNPENLIAKVTVNKTDDIVKTKTTYTKYKLKDSSKKNEVAGIKLENDDTLTAANYEKAGAYQDYFEPDEATKTTTYYVLFKDLGLTDYTRTVTKQQYGWIDSSNTEYTNQNYDNTTGTDAQWTTDKDPSKKGDVYKSDKEIELKFSSGGTTGGGTTGGGTTATDTVTLYFKTVGRTDTDNDNIKKNQEAIDAAASDAKKAADRDAQLAKLDEEKGALNNVNKGDGIKTELADVDGPKSVKDVKEFYQDGHAFEVAGIKLDDGLSNLAWVYYVEKPAGLINGKNARAQLKLPSGYTTSGYKATVYHIKGWCKAEKVKDVNVGTNDVAFWANDFSPYVLVLTPRDAVAGTSTGNPSTGDFSAVPVAMLAAAALGATGFVAYKKRKAE